MGWIDLRLLVLQIRNVGESLKNGLEDGAENRLAVLFRVFRSLYLSLSLLPISDRVSSSRVLHHSLDFPRCRVGIRDGRRFSFSPSCALSPNSFSIIVLSFSGVLSLHLKVRNLAFLKPRFLPLKQRFE